MSTQTLPEPQAAAPVHKSVLDDIVENAHARSQAEGARCDQLTAKIYASDANAYAIALGRDYGLAPAHALNMIHVIGGKPCLSAGARATFLKQAGYDWRPVEMSDKRVCLRFWHRDEPMMDAMEKPLEVAFTFEDAERAGFVAQSRGSAKVGNYDKFPKNMLFARCISNFHRWYAPEVIGATVYDRGEVNMDEVISATEDRIAAKSNERLEALEIELAAAKGAN